MFDTYLNTLSNLDANETDYSGLTVYLSMGEAGQTFVQAEHRCKITVPDVLQSDTGGLQYHR